MFIFEFPMNQSPLNSICFKTQAELEELLQRFGNMEAETFFQTTQLANYRLEAYPEP
jgi:hypothetical protein